MNEEDKKFTKLAYRVLKNLSKQIDKINVIIENNLTKKELVHIGLLIDDMEKDILPVKKELESLGIKC